MMKYQKLLLSSMMVLALTGCGVESDDVDTEASSATTEQVESSQEEAKVSEESKQEESGDSESSQGSTVVATGEYGLDTTNHTLIEVDGGDLSGYREPNVVVDIGYGDREYYAYTNDYGQLVRVVAKEVILQDDASEDVNAKGRYYNDEAKVAGVESDKLDEGHVLADSLGGVSNAYNITPQESTLNRHGDQAYMEEVIRKAGGASNFEAIITYPDTETQIPSHYDYYYTVAGNEVHDSFDNINPDDINEELGLTTKEDTTNTQSTTDGVSEGDVSSVDANGNGTVTIKEAKDAGFKMPIKSDHWLYQYMQDSDGDGQVGEAS